MARRFVDFAQLKEEVTIDQVVDMLDLKLKESNSQLRGACPACESGDRSLVITPAKGAYYCFADKKGGDMIALAAHVLGVSVRDAAIEIAETYGTGNSNSTSSRTAPQERGEPKENARSLQPLKNLASDHDAVIAVGLEPDDAEALGIGYCSKGMMRGYVAIPLRLPDGTLVGYAGVEEPLKLPPKLHIHGEEEADDTVVPFNTKRA